MIQADSYRRKTNCWHVAHENIHIMENIKQSFDLLCVFPFTCSHDKTSEMQSKKMSTFYMCSSIRNLTWNTEYEQWTLNICKCRWFHCSCNLFNKPATKSCHFRRFFLRLMDIFNICTKFDCNAKYSQIQYNNTYSNSKWRENNFKINVVLWTRQRRNYFVLMFSRLT